MKKLLINLLFKNYREDLKRRLLKNDITILDILKIKCLLVIKSRKRGEIKWLDTINF